MGISTKLYNQFLCVCVLVQVHVKTVQLKHDEVIQNKNSVGYSFHVNTNKIKIFSFK